MPKNIMVCFDGTSNHPKDAKQERDWFGYGEIEDSGITNVLKIHAMFGGNLRNAPSNKKVDGQHSLYYSGVGTYGNKVQQVFNSGFAASNLDVQTIMHTASRDLKEIYEDGDRIFVTGFSRGAAIARKFVSQLDRFLPGKLTDDHKKAGNRPVRFMGVFDTVASIGFPNLHDETKPRSDVLFEDHTISPYIEEALHLLSLDEKRVAFQPTLMNYEKPNRVTEVWFPGAHSDVGGGFWHDGLSDLALQFMLDEIERRKLGVKVLDPNKVDFGGLVGPKGSYQIDLEDLDLKPNPKAKHHPKDRWGPIATLTLDQRDIRVNENDAPSSKSNRPMIHESVRERMKLVVEYRPKALKGIKHHIMKNDGTLEMASGNKKATVFNGLGQYI